MSSIPVESATPDTLLRLFDGAPWGMAALDGDLRLLHANTAFIEAMEACLGVRVAPGEVLSDKIPAGTYLNELHRGLAEEFGDQESFEHLIPGPEGEPRCLELRLEPTALPDNRRGLLVYVRDNSVRKAYERSILTAQHALTEANRTRDLIFSIIAHDLRAPIAQLNAVLYFLRMDPSQLSASRLREYSHQLERSTRHLNSAVENLLHWSSLNRHTIEPRVESFDPAALVDETVGLLADVARAKRIELVVEPAGHCPVETDRHLLAYLLRNLIANAIKFTPHDGRIHVAYRRQGEKLVCFVRDTGVGISPSDLSRIRDPHNLHSTRGTSGERGTGLGLKVCFQFVDKLGGRLDLESVLNEGTTARIEIPAQLPSV